MPDSKIKLLIVDDHPVVREGLRSMFSKARGIEVVSVCSTGEAALHIAARHPVDVLLTDLRMTPMNGIELLRKMKRVNPECRTVVLSSYQMEEEIFKAVQEGAAGYISKDATPNEILGQIAQVFKGQRVFPAHMLELVEQRKRRKDLTPRELQILEMVARGLTNKEIARVLGISQFTVRNQVSSFSSKLDVCDRTEAARVAIEQGIIIL